MMVFKDLGSLTAAVAKIKAEAKYPFEIDHWFAYQAETGKRTIQLPRALKRRIGLR